MVQVKDRPKNVREVFHDHAVYSFIQSGYFYSASSSPLPLRDARYSTDTMSEFRAEAHRQLRVKDLPNYYYVAARARFKPATLRTKGAESTNEPPRSIS